MPTRWVGIDEAGYGPNLGPLVMSAVIAESPDNRPPDLWADLASSVCRAGEDPERLWVDDSKAIYKPGQGRDRLESTCRALVAEACGCVPTTFGTLLASLGAGTLDDAELTPWLDAEDVALYWPGTEQRPFAGSPWRIVSVRTEVVGPARFNAGLGDGSKATVHFAAFARLLRFVWELSGDGLAANVRGDKHGGRHFYYEPLVDAIPDAWIDRGAEGPELSQYTIRASGRRLALSLQPRADADDGLVALASIISKTVRELWMDAFNAHWLARIPGLKPTAGYPLDARRFRQIIEPHCLERGLAEHLWWRAK
jgi:hypothetical protein